MHVQFDAGVAGVEGAQHVGDEAGAQARRRAEPDAAAAQVGHLLDLAPGGLRVGEDAPGQRQQRLPGIGEGDVAPGTVEQLGAQLPLQGADLLRQGGLGDMHGLGGAREVPGLRDGGEVAELVQLHATQASRIHRRYLSTAASSCLGLIGPAVLSVAGMSSVTRNEAREPAQDDTRPAVALHHRQEGRHGGQRRASCCCSSWCTCLGNLKIFFGRATFDAYAHWLRTIGEPVLHHGWCLWIARVVLVAAVVAHVVAAWQLSRRDRKARPVEYVHRRRRATYATRTMRWGGVILALFIVWHILDLTTGTVNPRGQAGHPYENVVADFRTGGRTSSTSWRCAPSRLHVQHGFGSAALTLGAGRARRDRTLKVVGNVLAVALYLAFVSVPVGVMTGLVR